jgi:WD40 repeat protein
LLATGSKEDGDIRIFDLVSWKQQKDLILRGEGPGLLTCFSFICENHQHQSQLNKSSSLFCLASGYHSNMAKIWSIQIDTKEKFSQCLRVISFESSVLSVASSFYFSSSEENSPCLVFTDYYGSRRFFGIVKFVVANEEKICLNRKVKCLKEFPIVRIEFVEDGCEEEDIPETVCEDLIGNRF